MTIPESEGSFLEPITRQESVGNVMDQLDRTTRTVAEIHETGMSAVYGSLIDEYGDLVEKEIAEMTQDEQDRRTDLARQLREAFGMTGYIKVIAAYEVGPAKERRGAMKRLRDRFRDQRDTE